MPFEQRELAFQAKEAASNCLATFLNSQAYRFVYILLLLTVYLMRYRAALRYAVHDSLVTCAFSGLFLLKIANLFPGEVELPSIISQVEQLAQLLSEVAAERYGLTLRLMLANLRRKLGLGTTAPTPAPGHLGLSNETVGNNNGSVTPGALMSANTAPTNPNGGGGDSMFGDALNLSMEEFGFTWPAEAGVFHQNAIPPWLQEASFNDLGLPINGNDGIFLNAPGWNVDIGGPIPEAW
jgi:hypothetical protein